MSQYWKSLRNSFFAGLLVVVPVGASLGLLWWGVTLVTAWLPAQFSAPQHRLLAVVVLIGLTIGVGWMARRVIGKRLIALAEALIGQMPLLKRIYPFMKEISQTMLSGQKTMFQRVVLVEFPRSGVYSVGFVTGTTGGEAQAKINAQLLNVFVPTTPIPTNGFLILVPQDQVVNLEMSVAEGMKLVISGGTVNPPYPADGNRTR
jgi:uncharacterized membrane protein